MSTPPTNGGGNSVALGIRDELMDLLTDYFAKQNTGEFLIVQNDNELVWVDTENQAFYLITVQEAEARVNAE